MDRENYRKISPKLIDLARSFDAETEDKVIVHDGSIDLPRFTGESIAKLSDYSGTITNLDRAIAETIYLLGRLDVDRRFLLFITDKVSELTAKRFHRGAMMDRHWDTGTSAIPISFLRRNPHFGGDCCFAPDPDSFASLLSEIVR